MAALHLPLISVDLAVKRTRRAVLRDIKFNGTDCYYTSGEPTVLQGVAFGGIPMVLLIYFIIFWLAILLFSLLRKTAWEYGRLALVSDHDSAAMKSSSKHRRLSSFSSSRSHAHIKDIGFCSWILNVFTMKDSEMREHCGDDAMHYLSFQRHIILLLVAMSVMSVGIILPVNLSGSLLNREPQNFGRTTIGNIKIQNHKLWIHTVFAVIYLLLTILVLRNYTSSMQYTMDNVVKCTLFISGIPKEASKEIIAKHFSEAYPTCTVLEVELCHDVAKLMDLDAKRRAARRSQKYYRHLLQTKGKSVSVNRKPCGHFCCCSFKGCEQVDAVEYYTNLESKMMTMYTQEREEVDKKWLGLAFVTFQDESMATLVLKDFHSFRCHNCNYQKQTQPSSYSQNLGVSKWNVSYAPDPKSIYWENITVQGIFWWSRCILLNFLLFILLFFLTTPSIVLSTMDKLNVTQPIHYLNNPIISQFFPTLLLWAFTTLLPTLVYYSTIFEGHWTRSAENRIIMHKLYSFLIIMVLILPSLGLTSIDVFFRWLFDKSFLERAKVRFECVFLPDQGAFFVNYIIASAFIGNSMALLRLPNLLQYTIRMLMAKSAAERKIVTQQQAFEFEFGVNYAWMLCIFTVVVAYSITCPIIVPFGLIYILLKHLVDRYNLYYAYLPAQLNEQMHASVVKQALAAPIICLFWLLFFSVLRGGLLASTSIFTLIVLVLTIIIGIFSSCLGYFKYFTVKPKAMELPTEETEGEMAEPAWHSKAYLPIILHGPITKPSHRHFNKHLSYGAMGDSSHRMEEEESSEEEVMSTPNTVEDDDQIFLADTGASEI
uniref:CSC1-like protein 2 n=1 Tax=Pristiophorus japonicus TaxID=55135 RepID=UPI00398ED7CA